MKLIAQFLCLMLLVPISEVKAQRKCTTCQEWSADRKLVWADFKARPDKLSRNEALTNSGMSIELNCDDKTSEVVIHCYFDGSKSWTKNHSSNALLKHEQLHFDITELFVRKLRKRLEAVGNDCDKLSKQVEEYYQENYKEYAAYQSRYDSETRHSTIPERQAYWEKKVQIELDELKPYASLASN